MIRIGPAATRPLAAMVRLIHSMLAFIEPLIFSLLRSIEPALTTSRFMMTLMTPRL